MHDGVEIRRLLAEAGCRFRPGILRCPGRNLLRLARLAREDFSPDLPHSLFGDGARVVFGGAKILGAAAALGPLSKRGGLSRAGCRERLRRALIPDQLLDATGSVLLLWRWGWCILQPLGLRRY